MGNDVEGVDEFVRKVNTIQQRAPGRIIDELERESRSIVRMYRKRIAPHKLSGNLSKGTKAQKGATVRKTSEGKDYSNSIYRTKRAPHFHLFEEGHKVVPRGDGRGVYGMKKKAKPYKRYPSKGGITVVNGQHIFKNMMRAEEPKLQKKREKMVDKIFEELM